jgi:hypothetical protein
MTKTPGLLESPKRRLKRAKEKIRRLEKRIATFFKKKPGAPITETDAQGVTTHAFRFNHQIPESWGDVAVEAIEALRSALDQCGYAVAVRSGVAEPRNAYFPFGDTPTELDANTKGRCKDLPPEISTLFRSFESHKGGNYSLWALNKLCNANKHRLLMPVGIASGGNVINQMKIGGGVRVRVPTFDRDKNQIVVAETDPGAHFEYDMNLTFFVAFDEFNGVKGGPAVGILDSIAGEVDRVIRATEAECKRLGWK